MKVLKLLLAAAALMLCGTLAYAATTATNDATDPPAVAGRLSYVNGPVSFAPAEANENFSEAALNRPITTGDRLWTDTNGRAEIRVGSLAMRVGAQTSLDVLALNEDKIQLRLAQGIMSLRVRRLSDEKVLEISTPDGAVVVRRPGLYRINADPSSGPTTVSVRAGGEAEVFTGRSSFLVRDNQQAAISGTRQDLYAVSAADDFDRWAATRDQREERVVSTRYVPEEMTGYEDLDDHGTWRTTSDYGALWVPRAVPAGWAPYRQGHWVWVAPWGWTWVDRAPWGFAPFHYGRWVYYGNNWAWAPGRRVVAPVYAPALVAFIGGANWSVSVGAGPAVGWVPLGYREVYRPWYRTSPRYVQNVNVTHVTNVTNITNITNVRNVRYVNRNAPSAVTVVSRENFVGARQADQAAVRVSARTLAAAPVTEGAPVATPARTSFAAGQRGAEPPAAVRSRETVAVNAQPASAAAAERVTRREAASREAGNRNEERARVRVVERAQRVDVPASKQPAQVTGEAQRTQDQKAERRVETKGEAKGEAKGQTQGAAEAQRAQGQQAERRGETKGEAKGETKGQPQAQSGRNERAQDNAQQSQGKAAPAEANRAQDKDSAQAGRRGPPPEVTQRPTFDREMKQTAPRTEPRREAAPQAEHATPRPAPEAQRAQQTQQEAQRQLTQERQAREQQIQHQREEAQRQSVQRAEQTDEQRQRAADQQRAQRQREAQQQAQEQQQRAQPPARPQPKEQAPRPPREQQQKEQREQREQRQERQRPSEGANRTVPHATPAAEHRPAQRDRAREQQKQRAADRD